MDLGKVVGSKIHNVTGTPDASLGLAEDWALDTTSFVLWQKTEAGWENKGSFRGADGQNGQDGQDGAKGDPGEKGEKGDPGQDGAPGADGKTPTFSINDEGHLIAEFPG